MHNKPTREIFDMVSLEETIVVPGDVGDWGVNADVPHKHEEHQTINIHAIYGFNMRKKTIIRIQNSYQLKLEQREKQRG
jgi:hypothetical protein